MIPGAFGKVPSNPLHPLAVVPTVPNRSRSASHWGCVAHGQYTRPGPRTGTRVRGGGGRLGGAGSVQRGRIRWGCGGRRSGGVHALRCGGADPGGVSEDDDHSGGERTGDDLVTVISWPGSPGEEGHGSSRQLHGDLLRDRPGNTYGPHEGHGGVMRAMR